jgi:hypothetical protein
MVILPVASVKTVPVHIPCSKFTAVDGIAATVGVLFETPFNRVRRVSVYCHVI